MAMVISIDLQIVQRNIEFLLRFFFVYPLVIALLYVSCLMIFNLLFGDDTDTESSPQPKSSNVLDERRVVKEAKSKIRRRLRFDDEECRRVYQFDQDEVFENVDQYPAEGSVNDLGVSDQDIEFFEKCDVADVAELEKNSSGETELSNTPSETRVTVEEQVEEEVEVENQKDEEELLLQLASVPTVSSKDDEFRGVKKGKWVTNSLDNAVEVTDGDNLPHQIEEEDKSVDVGETRAISIEGHLDEEEKEEENMRLNSDEDDDWEGIERSELEMVFAKAFNFVNSAGNSEQLSSLGIDVQRKLHALQRVAIEGPCNETQLMALMFFARAKLNAWSGVSGLENMTPEMAMEQYIDILSAIVPGWMEQDSAANDKPDSWKSGMESSSNTDVSSSYQDAQVNLKIDEEQEPSFWL